MARSDVASRAAGGGRWRGRVAALAYLAAFALAIGVNLNPLYRSKPQQMAHDPLLSLPLPPPLSPMLPPSFYPPPPSPPVFPPPVPLRSPPPSVSPPPPSPPLSPPPSVTPPPPSPLLSPPPPLKEETAAAAPAEAAAPAAAAAAAAAQAASQEPAPALVTGAPPSPVVSAADAAADAEEGQESLQAGLTIVNTSSDPGAVCLDGSPPAFNWHPGRGTGKNKWILYLEVGAVRWSMCTAQDLSIRLQLAAWEGHGMGRNKWILYLEVGAVRCKVVICDAVNNSAVRCGTVGVEVSPLTFNWRPGRGTGRKKWILYLEGGAWCEDSAHCIDRSFSNFGSSTKMGDWLLQGLLSSSRTTNPGKRSIECSLLSWSFLSWTPLTASSAVSPNFGSSTKMASCLLQGLLSSSHFFNWNLVYIRYCDGASFVGNVDEPLKDHEGKPQVYMRGRRVFNVIISHLLAHHGMRSASHVLLSGCSAGGLAALLLCDSLADRMGREGGEELEGVGGGRGEEGGGEKGGVGGREGGVVVKCMSDGGYFLDARDVGGSRHFLRDTMFRPVTALHNVTLNPHCLASRPANDSWQCFFPQHFLPFLRTPLFILNSLYDSWQVRLALFSCNSNARLSLPSSARPPSFSTLSTTPGRY
ncbi:unnamed protein product [Closterium sp. Yama58-4]|nr:unnamed protein product [Closterium sp. Yama58-4]